MNLAEDITRSIDIVDYISKFLPLRKSGANWTGNCPFHNEKTPSFMVSDSKGIFKCFGCGKGGDVITFAMEYERLDFMDALKYLADYAHIDLAKYPKVSHDPLVKQHREEAKSLNQLASTHFEANLHINTKAKEYLYQRKLDDQIISIFHLGYATEDYYDMINFLKKQGLSNEQILESGLCKTGASGDIYDFFRNRIIFPVRDSIGNIVGFGGRVLDPKDSPKYLNLTSTTLYDKSKVLYGMNFMKKHINEHNKIIVVEGYMDVIALHRIGLPIGVATCGTALTAEHMKMIKRHTDHVYFIFDNDDAGFQATIRGLKIAYAQDVFPQVLQIGTLHSELGIPKDVDDLANVGGTSEQLMSTAIDAFLFVIERIRKIHPLSDPVEKKKALNILFDLIKSINDLSITQHYLGEISKKLDISDSILLSQYKTWFKQNKSFQTQNSSSVDTSKPSFNSKILLDVLLSNDNLKSMIQADTDIASAKQSHLEKCIQFYENLQHQYKFEQTDDKEIQDQATIQSNLLRREQELHGMDQTKQIQLIQHMLLMQIDVLLKKLVKTTILSPEQKTKLLEERKTLNGQ